MLQGWFVVAVALVSIGLLLVIAIYRDRLRRIGDAMPDGGMVTTLADIT
jgi:hypothetical protein